MAHATKRGKNGIILRTLVPQKMGIKRRKLRYRRAQKSLSATQVRNNYRSVTKELKLEKEAFQFVWLCNQGGYCHFWVLSFNTRRLWVRATQSDQSWRLELFKSRVQSTSIVSSTCQCKTPEDQLGQKDFFPKLQNFKIPETHSVTHKKISNEFSIQKKEGNFSDRNNTLRILIYGGNLWIDT